MRTIAAVSACLFLTAPAYAQEVKTDTVVKSDSPCVSSKKKKRKWRPRKKAATKVAKTCEPKVHLVQQCSCPLTPGPRGPKGEDGKTYVRGWTPSVGYYAAGLWGDPDYEWNHGPSLRFDNMLNNNKTFMLELGFAPGRDGGFLVKPGVTHWFSSLPWLGVGASVAVQGIGFNNGDKDNLYSVTLVPEVVVQQDIGSFNLSANVGPALGMTFTENDEGLNGGVVGGVGVGYRW